MKRLLWFLLLPLLFPLTARAQYTQLSATITDANGTAYQGCKGSFSWIDQNTDPGHQSLLFGSVFQTEVPISGCDGFGHFTLRLADNNQITPPPSQWQFSICDQTGVYCFIGKMTVTGATQDGSAIISSFAPPIPITGIIPHPPAYSIQVNNSPIGHLTSDPYATINPTTHTLSAAITNNEYDASSPLWGATPAVDIGPNVNAAFAVAKNTGAKVRVPASNVCWPVNTTIQFPTGTPNLHLTGDVQGGTCLTAGAGLGAHAVIEVGTAGVDTSTTGVHISYLTLSNGIPSATGPVVGYDGIRIDDGINVEIDHTTVTSIKGVYGIGLKYGSNHNIHDNIVTNFAEIGIGLLNNIDGFHVDHNWVDMAPIISSYINTYGIVVGGYEGTHDGVYYPKNGTIRGNTVRNIITWQGINSHGSSHVDISGNNVENVKSGIWLALQATSPPGPSSPELADIHIHDNHVSQCPPTGCLTNGTTGASDGEGITVQGDSVPNPVVFATRTWIENNDVVGFGASSNAASANFGSIQLSSVSDFHVNKNTCVTYNQQCIFLNIFTEGGEVTGNTGYDVLDGFAPLVEAVIGTTNAVWDVSVDGNCSRPTTAVGYPQYLVSNYTGAPTSHLKIGEKNCSTGTSKATYRGSTTGFTLTPKPITNGFAVTDGQKFYDNHSRPAWVANCSPASVPTAPVVTATVSGGAVNGITLTGGSGWPVSSTVYLPNQAFVSAAGSFGTGASAYFSTDGSGVPISPGTVITGGSGFGSTPPSVLVQLGKPGLCSFNNDIISTGTMALHGYDVTGLSGGSGTTFWYYYLPKDMNVSIAGAGPGGTALVAKVVSTNQLKLTLDTPAVTAVSGANITYYPANVASTAGYLDDPNLFFGSTPFQGLNIMGDPTLFKSSSMGFRFSSGGPVMAYNAYQMSPGSDSWCQSDTGFGSNLLDVSVNGIRHYVAAAGGANCSTGATFAAFWGSVRTTIAAGGITTTGTLTTGSTAVQITNAAGNVNGITASLVTTSGASDNVTVTGMTASGHCQLTATNAAAATNIATTFISAKTTNQITVAHAATANMNYDVNCWPN